ncbi:Uncharacterised protein [Mycobacteroides abscessus subsp. abscessus]|nr:Uncharacterised protein [Mycobacteroides abscessus subsp. abscessus]
MHPEHDAVIAVLGAAGEDLRPDLGQHRRDQKRLRVAPGGMSRRVRPAAAHRFVEVWATIAVVADESGRDLERPLVVEVLLLLRRADALADQGLLAE